MASALSKIETETYTEEDYYSLGEDIRAELINGQFYYMAAPSRIHQEILMYLSKIIANYIDSKKRRLQGLPCSICREIDI